MRLRERRIGPYKYPTIDKHWGGKNRPKNRAKAEKKTRAKKSIKIFTQRGESILLLPSSLQKTTQKKISTYISQHLRSRFQESRRKGINQAKVTNSRSNPSFAIISNASNRTGTLFLLLLLLSQLNDRLHCASELIHLHSVATHVR